jgi:hypothetical protein
MADPIGSPSKVTAANSAGSYFKVQLYAERPINRGSAASKNKIVITHDFYKKIC